MPGHSLRIGPSYLPRTLPFTPKERDSPSLGAVTSGNVGPSVDFPQVPDRKGKKMSPTDLVAQWRTEPQTPDNPAGPLYVGEYAESELINRIPPDTLHGCGTACTFSRTRLCC